MSLEQKVFDDYKQAFKDRDETKKGILNYVVAQLKNKKIEIQKDLSDDDVVSIIKKEIKSRNEAIEFLEKAGKTEDVAMEKSNIAVLQQYVPEMMSEAQLRTLVEQTITSLGIDDIKTGRGKIT